jgi:hypothetical protein
MGSRSGNRLRRIKQGGLECVLLRPLLRCLGLPRSTHGLSVLAVCGLLSMKSTHQLHQVRFLRRIQTLDSRHPSVRLFKSLEGVPVTAAYRTNLRLSSELSSTASGVSPDTKRSALAARALRDSLDDLKASDYGRFFKTLKTNPGLSGYLTHACRSSIALRARLRLNRSDLNESRLSRGWGASSHCDYCPGVDESVVHCLLECPRYGFARTTCTSAFAALGLSMTVANLLSCGRDLPRLTRRDAMSCSRSLLQAIFNIRNQGPSPRLATRLFVFLCGCISGLICVVR